MNFSFKLTSMGLALGLLIPATSYAVPDCTNTAWKPSNGQTCAKLGLHSHKAICETGHKFATLCDDSQSQIRTCKSDIRCDSKKKKKAVEGREES